MPVYEYVCHDCDQRFDARVTSFQNADSARCPSCDGMNLNRMISRVAFMSTGSDLPMSTANSGVATGGGCCGGGCGCGGHRA